MILKIYSKRSNDFFRESFSGINGKVKKKEIKRLYPSINLVSECFIRIFQFLYFRRDMDYFVDVLILLLRLILQLYCERSKAKIGQ